MPLVVLPDTMSVSNRIRQWILDEDLRVATALGVLSIPVTVAASWSGLPSSYTATPVLLAGMLAGFYYSNRSRSTSYKQAGLRTGVIGALPTLLNSASFVASGWALSVGYAAVGAGAGILWFGFNLVVFALAGVVGALIGSIVGRIPPLRRGEPQSA